MSFRASALAAISCFASIACSSRSESPAPAELRQLKDAPTPAAAQLTAQSFEIVSRILNQNRRIRVALPASYGRAAATRPYPVVLVTDGEALLGPVTRASDELSRRGQIPEFIVVGIENFGGRDTMSADRRRVFDLTPPGLSVSGSGLHEGGDLFLDFIEKELLPAVDRRFRLSPLRVFVGHSSGGILATYAAATRSTYQAVIALDAPVELSEGWLAKKLIARAEGGSAPPRYASLEARFGWSDSNWSALRSAGAVSSILYRESMHPLESHESIPTIGAYVGLRQLFADYSMIASPVAQPTGVLAHYARVSASLGAAVVPPRRVLEQAVADLLSEGQSQGARDALDALVAGYGAPADETALRARVEQSGKRLGGQETVESLLKAPFPTPQEVASYIGEWVGDVSMDADVPRQENVRLIIRVENGRVVGETINASAPLELRSRVVEYLRVTPKGLTWGSLNRMRPHAVVLFEGVLSGDVLSGQTRFGGIDFVGDDGQPPPSLYFRFRRVAK